MNLDSEDNSGCSTPAAPTKLDMARTWSADGEHFPTRSRVTNYSFQLSSSSSRASCQLGGGSQLDPFHSPHTDAHIPPPPPPCAHIHTYIHTCRFRHAQTLKEIYVQANSATTYTEFKPKRTQCSPHMSN